MADKKISQLNAAATPLAGTEVLPIVQSGSTVKVSVADLTSGRTVTASNISAGLGAVGAPSYTFTGDLNTGIFSPAADTTAFVEGGVEAMRITSTGNVGVGTSSPSARLHAVTATGAYAFRATSGSSRIEYAEFGSSSFFWNTGSTFFTGTTSNHDYVLGSNNAERVRITAGGLVGVGTGTPNAAALLDVSSTTSGFLPPRMTTAQRDLIATPPNGLMLYNTTTDKLQVRAAGVWVDLH